MKISSAPVRSSAFSRNDAVDLLWNAAATPKAFGGRRFGLVYPHQPNSPNGGRNPRCAKVLPLPEGEGWGEGEGIIQLRRDGFRRSGSPTEARLKAELHTQKSGHVLLMVLFMVSVAVIIMVGLYTYTSGSTNLNIHTENYYSSVLAAEAATEKVLAQIDSDFQNLGEVYITNHLDSYRRLVPTSDESSEWTNYDFLDLSGTTGQNEINYAGGNTFTALDPKYGALKGNTHQVRILSNARKINSVDGVVGSVYQDIQMTEIPIFQYAIFYNVVLEFTPLPNMTITGPVHCNTNIYNNPQGTLTFMGNVTAAGTIVEGRNANSPQMPALGGSTVYKTNHTSNVSSLSLPIGTNNSPAAVHQVLEIPPATENINSSLARQRYYNQADLIVLVSNANVVVKSGLWNSFSTALSSNEWGLFISTNTSFYNYREGKTVKAIQLNVTNLVMWNATNLSIRPYLPNRDVNTIYIADLRTFSSSYESGVRLTNGITLPPLGLTIATPSPVYVQGDYNVAPSQRGTTNTTGSVGASIACDAITFLSNAWQDTNAASGLSSRTAVSTTMNVALIAGIVASTSSADSGGVENFPRYLENWDPSPPCTNTYNGSMVCMTYSQIANTPWHFPKESGGPDDYNPPVRNWSLDQNFQYYDKLPPHTPSLMVLMRSNWRQPAAFSTNVFAGY